MKLNGDLDKDHFEADGSTYLLTDVRGVVVDYTFLYTIPSLTFKMFTFSVPFCSDHKEDPGLR